MTREQRLRGLLVGALLLLPGLLLAGPGQWMLRRWNLPLWPAALPGFVLLFAAGCIVYLALRAP
jgi:zinc transporter ZupT